MIYALHEFTTQDWDNGEMPFDPKEYSLLKFGHDATAKQFGYDLANGFFEHHVDQLLSRPTVVIPSPFNYVENAATVMTRYFINRLNHLLVNANGEHVDYSIIHRKVSYTNDYGFMTADQRVELLKNDQFYINEGFYRDKNIIFIDDIRITGTHEKRLRGILSEIDLGSAHPMYLYYAQLVGECRPEIEAALNFSTIKSVDDFVELASQPDHNIIVRPIKYLLNMKPCDFGKFLEKMDIKTIQKVYNGSLGEGYYRIPDYQINFQMLREWIND
jgi:hypothetical protein